jgi:thioredoxin 1
MNNVLYITALAGILAFAGCGKKENTAMSNPKPSSQLEQTIEHSKNITHITKDNLDVLYSGNVIVDVWNPKCGPCMEFAKPYSEAAEKYSGKDIKFAKMNSGEGNNRELMYALAEEKRWVSKPPAIPCVVFMKDGKEIDRFVGNHPELLDPKIEQHYLTNQNK